MERKWPLPLDADRTLISVLQCAQPAGSLAQTPSSQAWRKARATSPRQTEWGWRAALSSFIATWRILSHRCLHLQRWVNGTIKATWTRLSLLSVVLQKPVIILLLHQSCLDSSCTTLYFSKANWRVLSLLSTSPKFTGQYHQCCTCPCFFYKVNWIVLSCHS